MEHKEGLVFGSQEQRLRLKPVGHYKVWAFVNSPSKTVVAEFEVTQPKVKLVQWVYPDKETGKKVTGWEEENTVKMVFESAQGLEAEVVLGVVRNKIFEPLLSPQKFKIEATNEATFKFGMSKPAFQHKVAEGDYLSVRIHCTTPGQTISMEGAQLFMLQFSGKERIQGIAFYGSVNLRVFFVPLFFLIISDYPMVTEAKRCKQCDSTDIKKNGSNSAKNAKYKCKKCGFGGVFESLRHDEAYKELVVAASQERSSSRGLGRTFNISHQTALDWIKKKRSL